MLKVCVFLLSCLVLPPAVAAQCGQWDVSGRWEISFGEGSSPLYLDLKGGGEISGRAQTAVSNNFGFTNSENLKGKVSGDKIDFTIERISPTYTVREEFHGVIDGDGRITGKAFIAAFDGNLNVQWRSNRPMRCLAKAVTKLGVKHTDPSAQGAPFIVAAPNNIALPFGQTTGITTIVWDGGKDHPYAEVWMKVDNQDETKILEQGKGTLQQAIAVGRTYTYILTDAGTTLATVTVRFRQ
jgi:hypothetical protein